VRPEDGVPTVQLYACKSGFLYRGRVMAELLRRVSADAWERLREGLAPISVAALGAGIAWLVAHDVLGHRDPFFAPIAAAIALSTSRVGRTFRTIQMVGGVLLGIAIGVELSKLLGTTAIAIGLIAFATLAVARMIGAGFVGQGMMFANQAASSAILVVALHKSGTGYERGLDAIVGGAVALFLGLLVFPPEPLGMLAAAEHGVLCSLSDTLAQSRAGEGQATACQPKWLIERTEHAHSQLEILARSAETARRTVRVAPRRWGLRRAVLAEIERSAQMWPMVDAVIGLARSVVDRPEQSGGLSTRLQEKIDSLRAALHRLATSPRPWSAEVLEEVRRAAQDSSTSTAEVDRGQIVTALLRTAATDVAALIDDARRD
jgi:uncharacterized membrane protein YgaE (UPF0421/DUF939 family)